MPCRKAGHQPALPLDKETDMELIQSCLGDVIIITTIAFYGYIGLWFGSYLIRRVK